VQKLFITSHGYGLGRIQLDRALLCFGFDRSIVYEVGQQLVQADRLCPLLGRIAFSAGYL
jgi:hypothetical protein